MNSWKSRLTEIGLNNQDRKRKERTGRESERSGRRRNLKNSGRWSDHIEGKGFLLLWWHSPSWIPAFPWSSLQHQEIRFRLAAELRKNKYLSLSSLSCLGRRRSSSWLKRCRTVSPALPNEICMAQKLQMVSLKRYLKGIEKLLPKSCNSALAHDANWESLRHNNHKCPHQTRRGPNPSTPLSADHHSLHPLPLANSSPHTTFETGTTHLYANIYWTWSFAGTKDEIEWHEELWTGMHTNFNAGNSFLR